MVREMEDWGSRGSRAKSPGGDAADPAHAGPQSKGRHSPLAAGAVNRGSWDAYG